MIMHLNAFLAQKKQRYPHSAMQAYWLRMDITLSLILFANQHDSFIRKHQAKLRSKAALAYDLAVGQDPSNSAFISQSQADFLYSSQPTLNTGSVDETVSDTRYLTLLPYP
jgi:hypothetical protein